ncbi:exodeoxyribonuclease VII large subunit [Halanaerobacter jeridensis]|uniref:Exodeoxyribonuclease 7 large subunit n=1 Tax=Halanaerobacter jeridensis TaxID=706427 RepID=A0A938XPS8_9FIRM|nr:exodeoxyribonuclease VII large subunit [Halanaerobacter jeridensis]MBM7555239.1 exodeoxyribonuclease VII large subunit [Halanaerobacter jeridensis]
MADLMEEVLTVSQLNDYIKGVLQYDPNLQQVLVQGEVSNYYCHYASGHVYFTLKDEDTQLKAVMFNRVKEKVEFELEDGMEVVLEGQITVYPPRGEYQIQVSDVQPKGTGALHIAFEQLKKKLEKEGLFKEQHKRELPEIPQKIGVITSPTGAAIRDIISVVKRRFTNVSLLIAPATVQGDNAEPTLLRGLELLNDQFDVDVIIIGRGGGSLEDLWAFNKEKLARAIFNSKTPVISAVGHETDYTISDFVADLRAPTPSAAAELVVSDRQELKKYLQRLINNLNAAINNKLEQEEQRLDNLISKSAFRLFPDRINENAQKIDDLAQRLDKNMTNLLAAKEDKLEAVIGKLDSLSPLHTLGRGYSLTRRVDNEEKVKSITEVEVGNEVEVIVQDGELICEVKDIKQENEFE